MKEISELQKKRAVNLIWNAAEDHSFTPDFKVFDSNAKAEVYWNTVIGAVRKHYDYPKLEEIFHTFAQYEDSEIYEGLLWLGLENAVFEREREDRPVLAALRQDYAERFVSELDTNYDMTLYDALAYAHYCRVLGRPYKLDRYNSTLLDELEFTKDMSTEDIVARAKTLFDRWFQICTEERKKQRKPFTLPGLKKRNTPKGRYRRFGIGIADRPDNAYGGTHAGGQSDEVERSTRLSAEELRVFMEAKYGKPAFTPLQMSKLERTICIGNHELCHLLITKGDRGQSAIQNGFEALQREREAKQIAQNRAYYVDHIAARRTAVQKLTGKIQNSVLLHLQSAPVRANSGKLEGGRVWRALYLNDNRVFSRTEQDNMGDLSVDLLLDASTSQKERQAIVSNQGVIIAEALNRCNIPCRVMSFCSMTGYTILRIFRDYNERQDNKRIFEYVSNGCNRDGLAIRTAHTLMSQTAYEHRILIILSDAKPNDVMKMHDRDGELVKYESANGIVDTALEVRRARADGISVICVFTGDDEDVASAKLIYGRDFARIQSLDKLADTVGNLIQNQIKLY